MGGYITLAFAEKFADMLSGFGLIHSSASADSAEKKNSRKQGIQMIEEYGAYPFLKNTIPNLFSRSFKASNSVAVDELIDSSRHFSKEALIQYYTAMMNRNEKTDVLEKAGVPVLFVIGREDTAAPLDVVIHQVHLPKISHIHIFDNVAHTSMLEAPDDLNKVLQEFVSVEY
jgi:pimeloyl-ACP methyl ester carboxylesterase